jgi:NifB/MoaA-like Fe-S oxidoreductase
MDLELDKDMDEDLGFVFNGIVFDKIKTAVTLPVLLHLINCRTVLRNTLYLKDDDYRYSFFYGNFINPDQPH